MLPSTWTPPPAPARDTPGDLEPSAGAIRTSLAGDAEVDTLEAEGEPSSRAEYAVPWLIGFILLLAGMVIVLLALIFVGDESLRGGGAPTASLPALVGGSLDASPGATAEPSATVEPSATPEPTATPLPWPEYGPLEMVYQGRSTALAPIYLLHGDFTVEAEPVVLARDDALDVRRFAWAPDGTVGAAILADRLVSVEIGVSRRPLAEGISTATFAESASTVYAVRVTRDGVNDVAAVLAINFADGVTTELASVTYPRPLVDAEPDLPEAAFEDDGGIVRLYAMDDGTLRLWVLGGGAWEIGLSDGETTELDPDAVPLLWAPGGEVRVAVTVADGVSTLQVVDEDGEEVASRSVTGLVSHLRWAPSGRRVVFTVGTLAPNGGVLQDLWLWDPESEPEEEALRRLTTTGKAFGAEWRGIMPLWRD